jgi:hypothetical protein
MDFFTHPILKQYPVYVVQDAIDTVIEEEGECNYEDHIDLVLDLVVNDS